MEDELRCPMCKQLFANPVLLPCYHAICMTCAIELQTPSTASASNSIVTTAQIHSQPHQLLQHGHHHSHSQHQHPIVGHHQHQHHHHHQHHHSTSSTSSQSGHSSTGSTSATESVSSDQDQADKVSILSEADSGVICCTSRPGSYAGTPNLQGLLFPPAGTGAAAVYSLACPQCRKLVFFDEVGARNLPAYRTMESIVDRFCEREALRCQMCETEPKVAAVVCEQCEIRYCEACRELCHPARGPLAKHTLVKPRGASLIRDSVCADHAELLSMYCMVCKVPTCEQCRQEGRHQGHEVQAIASMCKAQKVSEGCGKSIRRFVDSVFVCCGACVDGTWTNISGRLGFAR